MNGATVGRHYPWANTSSRSMRINAGANPNPMCTDTRTRSTTTTNDPPTSTRADVETTWTHLKAVSKIKLPNGRLSMLVELVLRTNIMEGSTEKEFALEAEPPGQQTTYEQRKHRLNVNGVDTGSALCDEEANMPIAIKFEDEAAVVDMYSANVATGSGSDLPAMFGLQSMQNKGAVILLRRVKEMIV